MLLPLLLPYFPPSSSSSTSFSSTFAASSHDTNMKVFDLANAVFPLKFTLAPPSSTSPNPSCHFYYVFFHTRLFFTNCRHLLRGSRVLTTSVSPLLLPPCEGWSVWREHAWLDLPEHILHLHLHLHFEAFWFMSCNWHEIFRLSAWWTDSLPCASDALSLTKLTLSSRALCAQINHTNAHSQSLTHTHIHSHTLTHTHPPTHSLW